MNRLLCSIERILKLRVPEFFLLRNAIAASPLQGQGQSLKKSKIVKGNSFTTGAEGWFCPKLP